MSPKKPVKKRAAAKTVQRTVRKPRRAPRARALVDAPPEKCFWVNCGPILRNLRELRDALARGISDVQFAYHVGPGWNHFANWVEDVLRDAACAQALRRARTRRAALRAVEASLAVYK